MNQFTDFPNDENGAVLRSMLAEGDDLTKPRMVDFCFVFPERENALAFVKSVDERDLEVCISYYEKREMWEVVIQKHMAPSHKAITDTEAALTNRAQMFGGEADGWGCMQV